MIKLKCLIVPIIFFLLVEAFYIILGYITLTNTDGDYFLLVGFIEGILLVITFKQAKGIYETNVFKEGMKELFNDSID